MSGKFALASLVFVGIRTTAHADLLGQVITGSGPGISLDLDYGTAENGSAELVFNVDAGSPAPSPSVPDGGLSAAMLGLALIGLAALRRKAAA